MESPRPLPREEPHESSNRVEAPVKGRWDPVRVAVLLVAVLMLLMGAAWLAGVAGILAAFKPASLGPLGGWALGALGLAGAALLLFLWSSARRSGEGQR